MLTRTDSCKRCYPNSTRFAELTSAMLLLLLLELRRALIVSLVRDCEDGWCGGSLTLSLMRAIQWAHSGLRQNALAIQCAHLQSCWRPRILDRLGPSTSTDMPDVCSQGGTDLQPSNAWPIHTLCRSADSECNDARLIQAFWHCEPGHVSNTCDLGLIQMVSTGSV